MKSPINWLLFPLNVFLLMCFVVFCPVGAAIVGLLVLLVRYAAREFAKHLK